MPWYAWLFCPLAGVACAAVALAFLPPVGVLVVLVVVAVLMGLLLWSMGLVLQVVEGRLHAGPATIEVEHLGELRILDPSTALRLRGRDVDPRAYHLIRSWVPTAVTLQVVDESDPAPYWYLSTRRPRDLVAAVEAARAAPPRS